jgi:salicylate hydroxylase
MFCRYDMYRDIEQALLERRGEVYTDKFSHGLPVGLRLPNGVVIGE